MDAPRIKPAIALSEAEERDAYPHPGRRLSRYERVSREKPLPHVPVPVMGPSPRELRRKSDMRIPSHRCGQSYSHLPSQPRTPANLTGSSPWQNSSAERGAPRESASMHTLKTATSQPMRTVNKAASFSASPMPPGASGHRSSKKINQLIGHDLDVPVDPYGLEHKNGFSYAPEYFEASSSSNSGSGSDSDDYLDEQSCFNMEEGLLPLLEEDEEGLSSRENSWTPRTPGTRMVPPPLNIRRHGSSPSVGSATISSSEHSPIHATGANFSLSSDLPMRWDPAYGQFTDKRAATDYHRFAAELAMPAEHEKAAEPTSLPKRHTIIYMGSPAKNSLKSKSTGKLRQSGTAAIYRLWEDVRDDEADEYRAPTPPPSLPPLPSLQMPPTPPADPVASQLPALTSRRNTLKKQRPSMLSTVEEPTKPAPQRSFHARSKSASQPSPQSFHVRSKSTPHVAFQALPPPRTQTQTRTQPQPQPATQCSVFDCDSDDEGGKGLGRRWWRRSDEEERRSSSEWPSVQLSKQPEEQETTKEKTSFGDGVKGLFANARDRALLSPAERRRSELRKSIKVLRAPGIGETDARRAR